VSYRQRLRRLPISADTLPRLHDWSPSDVPGDVPGIVALHSALEGERLTSEHRKGLAKAVLNMLGVGLTRERVDAPVSPRDAVRPTRDDLKDDEVRRRYVLVFDGIGWASRNCFPSLAGLDNLPSTDQRVWGASVTRKAGRSGRLSGEDNQRDENNCHGESVLLRGTPAERGGQYHTVTEMGLSISGGFDFAGVPRLLSPVVARRTRVCWPRHSRVKGLLPT
jgi:hypothetical protein